MLSKLSVHTKRIAVLLMALITACALALILAPGMQTAQADEGASAGVARPSTSGALHVEGSQLVDSNGDPVQLRGISTHGLAWYPEYVNQECFSELADWGANVVRLAMYTAEYGGYCTGGDQEELKNLVRQGVEYATAADMYVIIDWHILSDGTPVTYQSEAEAFFAEMSAEFAGYDNVIYEICNEPNTCDWATIKAYAEDIIPIIRANDPGAIIIVGTPTWSQDVDQVISDPITGWDNIMYALHFYAATHKDDLRAKLIAAVEAGLPIIVTEFCICDASGSGDLDYGSAEEWVYLMNQYGISYVDWSLSNKDESSAIIQPYVSKTSGFTTDDLSESGLWLYNLLNSAQSEGSGSGSAVSAGTGDSMAAGSADSADSVAPDTAGDLGAAGNTADEGTAYEPAGEMVADEGTANEPAGEMVADEGISAEPGGDTAGEASVEPAEYEGASDEPLTEGADEAAATEEAAPEEGSGLEQEAVLPDEAAPEDEAIAEDEPGSSDEVVAGDEAVIGDETASDNVARPSTSGALHVDGTQLVDSNGDPVQLRGISTHGLAWYPEYVNQECFSDLASWGANVVRLAMYTDEYGGYCSGGDQEELKDLIRQGVEYATEADMYVIIDWHILSEGTPVTYQSEAEAFFAEMSAEFAGYDNVIYEICNEPNTCDWATIKAYAEDIIPIIRANDPDAIIIVGTPTWSQDVDQAAADPITDWDNIMYTLHFYAATHKDDLRAKMVNAIAAGLPIFVTEYGICDASGNGALDLDSANTWIALMNEYGISYIAWNLSNKDESSAIFRTDVDKTSGFTPDDLSESGTWVYNMLTTQRDGEPWGEGSVVEPAGGDEAASDEPVSSEQPAAASGSAVETDGMRADVALDSSWEAGGEEYFLFRMSVTNIGDASVSSWTVNLTFNGEVRLSDCWNSVCSAAGNVLTVSSVDYNGSLGVGDAANDIGFIVIGASGLALS